ncbi:glycoside hydrolase family 43 protein [Shewanella sp. KJ2020]|uniref:glycoside hydrolase family 43 protein n=1 Tax=Shewanella sp. KJ2020 TaxID=2919172 RepID=UPI0020A77E9B|nr:glycoside hydrolase family 43 protein [Shewanella sp. KJ2020]MCP3127106.1 glycoside hydrolase family 43 protein [Shewanella sp. KJ2020]
MKKAFSSICVSACLALSTTASTAAVAANPLFTDVFTADPAAIVHQDTVYLYTGHDVAKDNRTFFEMHDWLVFSSKDMHNWTAHGSKLSVKDFSWAKGDAWASHVIEKDGKFYWYVTARHNKINGFAIGVAVADSPLGPFKDARGSAIITNDMTTDTEIDWDDIDPAVFIDDDKQAYLFWGNTKPRFAKLKPNMIGLDGPIHSIDIPNFTEALWVHKKDKTYYLSYASGFPEKIAYATSDSILGPWKYQGILNEVAGNSPTNHQAIIEFKGKSYFIYHTGVSQDGGGEFRRSVAIDPLYYNADGTIKRIHMTSEGISEPQ